MFKTVELGEVLNYEQPTRYIVESDIYNDEYDVPVLTAGKSFILGYTNEKENIYQNYPVIIFDDFTTATKYVDFPFKVKSSAMKILSCDENIADIKFLFYLIQTIKINSEQHQRYWISKFSKIQIPLPPLATQKAIAEKLDKADALRKKDQELLKQYDELAQSIFIDMFGDPVQNEKGWEKVKFEDESIISSGGTPSTRIKEYWDNGTIPWIGSNMCQNRILLQNDGKFITELGLNNSSARIFEKDTVLIALVGATIGKVALLKFSTATNQNIAGINANCEKYNSVYIFHLMINLYSEFLSLGNGGFRMANLSFIRNLPLLSPPLDLQNQFAEKIKNIEAQKALVKQQAQQSEDLFQALLQQSFTF